MTKAEVIKALEPFKDDAYVGLLLYSDSFPDGAQVAIQAIRAYPPWHEPAADKSNWLVGVVAHSQNRELPPEVLSEPDGKQVSDDYEKHLARVADTLTRFGGNIFPDE